MSLLSFTSLEIDIIFTVHTRQENLLQTVNEGLGGTWGNGVLGIQKIANHSNFSHLVSQ